MDRLPHGYTNITQYRTSAMIEKRFVGPDRDQRSWVEVQCLRHLRSRLPVPELLDFDEQHAAVLLRSVAGIPGQDLVDGGRAEEVLALLGGVMRNLHAVPIDTVPDLHGSGSVIVHGDFGPQNVVVDGRRFAWLLDWEFARLGEPTEDLAWGEWIMRIHHRDHLEALPTFFEAADLHPSWPERHDAMMQRCLWFLRRADAHGDLDASARWRQRLRLTERWVE